MPFNDLRRRSGSRPTKRVILIACEGLQEQYYFQHVRRDLRTSAVAIEVAIFPGDSERMVREAAARKVSERFDEVWCVFDTEFPADNPRFPNAVTLARRERIGLAVSNPAFEFWLLLHFVRTTRGFTSNDELVDALKGEYSSYRKNNDSCGDFWPHQAVAKANAEAVLLQQARSNPGEEFPHPSTTVHRLVEYLAAQR